MFEAFISQRGHLLNASVNASEKFKDELMDMSHVCRSAVGELSVAACRLLRKYGHTDVGGLRATGLGAVMIARGGRVAKKMTTSG